MTVRRRHTGGVYKRSTHSPSSIDFSNPAFSTTLYSSQADLMPVGATDVAPGAVLPGTIAPGAVGLSAFAASVRPVAIVGALPTLPDASYPDGSTVVLTTDDTLYQNVAGVWTAVGGGIEIVGTLPTLPDALYPVGTVVSLTTDGKLYRNVADVWTKAVDGADLIADSVTANAIAVGTITATEIAATTITGSQLAAGAVTAGKISAGAIATTDFSATATIALVTNSLSEVIIDASGLSITNGKLTVTNPGSVVIIDGTSDMFRIAATGIYYTLFANANSVTSNAVEINTGFNYPPASMAFLEISTAISIPLPGGALTTGWQIVRWQHETQVTSGTKTTYRVYTINNSGIFYGQFLTRYYILAQAAI